MSTVVSSDRLSGGGRKDRHPHERLTLHHGATGRQFQQDGRAPARPAGAGHPQGNKRRILGQLCLDTS